MSDHLRQIHPFPSTCLVATSRRHSAVTFHDTPSTRLKRAPDTRDGRRWGLPPDPTTCSVTRFRRPLFCRRPFTVVLPQPLFFFSLTKLTGDPHPPKSVSYDTEVTTPPTHRSVDTGTSCRCVNDRKRTVLVVIDSVRPTGSEGIPFSEETSLPGTVRTDPREERQTHPRVIDRSHN